MIYLKHLSRSRPPPVLCCSVMEDRELVLTGLLTGLQMEHSPLPSITVWLIHPHQGLVPSRRHASWHQGSHVEIGSSVTFPNGPQNSWDISPVIQKPQVCSRHWSRLSLFGKGTIRETGHPLTPIFPMLENFRPLSSPNKVQEGRYLGEL